MRILADENVPGPIVVSLRGLGHDVLYARESMSGVHDRVLLEAAQDGRRVLVTVDTDFGDLAFRYGLPAESGVALIRLDWRDPERDNAIAVAALTSRDDWSGVFAVIESDRIRVRPLPSAARDS